MLDAATGDFNSNPVLYINSQLMYHLGLSPAYIRNMSDEEWAEQYAILRHIREQEAKQRPQL